MLTPLAEVIPLRDWTTEGRDWAGLEDVETIADESALEVDRVAETVLDICASGQRALRAESP